jgi:hypothetical protein
MLPALLGFLAAQAYAGGVVETTNPQTGLLTWQVEDAGFSLELIQLHPDFIRAIYGSKDFPDELVEEMASYCVFGTIAKNTSDSEVRYRVADWRYRLPNGSEYPVKTKSEWLEEWRKRGIRFAWSLLPDDQIFAVGDWNQGFTTIKAPRTATFDLIYSWQLGDKHHVRTLTNLSCPPEQLPAQEN